VNYPFKSLPAICYSPLKTISAIENLALKFEHFNLADVVYAQTATLHTN